MLVLAIFTGGALGAVARYGLSGWVYERLGSGFPWGTLSVNMVGSLALGVLLPILHLQAPVGSLQGFVSVGCIGAFTTFSTFAYETVLLMREGQRMRALTYVTVSVVLGLASLLAGLTLAGTVF